MSHAARRPTAARVPPRRGFALLLTVAVVSAALAAAVLGVGVMQKEQANAAAALESVRAQAVLYAGMSHVAAVMGSSADAPAQLFPVAAGQARASVGDLVFHAWGRGGKDGKDVTPVPFSGGSYTAWVMPGAGASGRMVTVRVVGKVGKASAAGELVVAPNPLARLESAAQRCGGGAAAGVVDLCDGQPEGAALLGQTVAQAQRASQVPALPERVRDVVAGLGTADPAACANGPPAEDACKPVVAVAPAGLTVEGPGRVCGCGLLVVGEGGLALEAGARLDWRGTVVVKQGAVRVAAGGAKAPTRGKVAGALVWMDPKGSLEVERGGPRDPLAWEVTFNKGAAAQAAALWPTVERRAFHILY